MAPLYERFINYIIFSAEDPKVFVGNEELLDFVGPGGQNDAKIDGFGIRVNGQLISSKEDIQRIIEANRKIEVEFIAIQTKMQPRFNTTEFLAFGLMLQKFFSANPPIMNDELKELYELKNLFFNDIDILSSLKSNPTLKIYYATTGHFKGDEHYVSAEQEIKKMFDEELRKGDFLESVDIEVIDAKKTCRKVDSLENTNESLLNIQKSMYLTVGFNENVKKAVSFTCSAGELLKMLQNEDGTLRKALFNDNVRDYLGSGNINKEIEETMLNEPELFLLCNNGITIVSSDFDHVKNDLVKIVNPQIVNGCQTSNTLFKLRNKVDKDKLLLSVRVICTDDSEISNKVVRSTNRQNQVLEEAFETTKPYHHEMEKMFNLTKTPVQLYYERRLRQYDGDPLIPKSHIVNLRSLTHVFVASMLEYPHKAHRHEAKLLEEFTKESTRLFNPEHSLHIYYICGLLYYRVEEAFKNNHRLKPFNKYRGHLYFIVRNLIATEVPVLKDSSQKFKQFSKKMMTVLADVNAFNSYIDKSSSILKNTVKLWQEKGNSPHGIKDNIEFTEYLKKEIVKFKGKKDIDSVDTKKDIEYYTGEILTLRYNDKGLWYAFIVPDLSGPNLYFDQRNYKGEVRKIIPKTRVEYTLKKSKKGTFVVDTVKI